MAVIVNIRRYKTNSDYKEGTNSNLPDLKSTVVYQNPVSTIFNNKTALSLTGEGTDEKPFTLVNDLETVPPHHYYGTDDEENVRGYFPLDEAITQIFNTNNYYNSLTASIYNIVINMMGGFKASYVVETAETTYTQVSTWTTNEAENKIGNFKAVVTIHDTVTDNKWVLQNVLGFDYVGTPVQLDRTILTDSSLTLALSVNGSNYLQATVNNMPNNVKRVHFCFERCTQKVVFNILTAKVGEFILLGLDVVFNLQRGTLFETGTFTLTGNSIGSPNSLLAETGVFLIETFGVGFRGKEETICEVSYGLLYNWYAANDSRNIGSSGWSTPTEAQVHILRTYLDPSGGIQVNSAGGKLKETGTVYWNSPNTGATNEVGFNGKGAGIRTDIFKDIKFTLYFFTTYSDANAVGNAVLFYNNNQFWASNGATHISITPKSTGASVRLLKDSTTLTNGQSGTYTGNDGRIYRTICIGTQEWLADNLAETKYRNGDTIPEVTGNSEWSALTTGALCAYNNDWNNVVECQTIVRDQRLVMNTSKATFTVTMQTWGFKNRLPVSSGVFRLSGKNIDFSISRGILQTEKATFTLTGINATLTYTAGITTVKYGLLYNWYAATDSRNISSDGWRVPLDTDFQTLVTYLGSNAGGKLKETGLVYWSSPNTGATNEVGFNGRGSGERRSGDFYYLNEWLRCWTTRQYADPSSAYIGILGRYSTGGTYVYDTIAFKYFGQSIRLIKNSTTLTNGQTGTYIGNDGRAYRTICIGTQEWLADNLVETKYRNGDIIPEVTDDTIWGTLSTSALCAFENDWSNV